MKRARIILADDHTLTLKASARFSNRISKSSGW